MPITTTEATFNALLPGVDTALRNTSAPYIADREKAKAEQARANLELEQTQYARQSGAIESEVDSLKAKNDELSNTIARQDTFRAFEMYDADGDPRHLMDTIKRNPLLRDIYKDTVAIDKLNIETDQRLLADAGIDPSWLENPEALQAIKKRYLKFTRADGDKVLVDMFKAYQGTGYLNYVSNQDLERKLKEAQIQAYLNKGGRGPDGGERRTAMQKDAAAVAAARDRIAAAEANGEEPSSEDLELVKFGDKAVAGTTPGKFGLAKETTNSLLEEFGGPTQFFNTDFSKRDNYLRAIPYIREIEALEGIELTSAQKSMLTDIRGLIAISNDAVEISPAETGLLDNMLLGFRKYLTDNVSGLAATSSYATFRNAVRRALYGAALTDAEISSFNEAFATLGQKTGPVLAQFKTALQQVRSNLDSIAKMTNPYSAQVRLGADSEQLDLMIDQIDKRIKYLSGTADLAKPEVKQSLDSIFKGTR